MKDVLALREEPFMTTPEDYRAAIEFQLSGYMSSVGRVDVMRTWKEVAAELMAHPEFGRRLKPTRAVKQQVETLTAGLTGEREKMEVVYDFVRTTITWNGEYGGIAEQSLNDVLKTQSATNTESTLLLVSMLRAAGLEAHPVLISTRSHGQIMDVYPLLSQFNATLAAVNVGGETLLLDATDPLRPYTLLPTEALNGKGWLVREPEPAWVSIDAKSRYLHKMMLDATLDADGTLTASLEASDDGYSALAKRYQLKEVDHADFAAGVLLGDLDEVQIDSCMIVNESAVTEPLKTTAGFSAPGYAQVAGDFIYFNPMPVGRLEENPLRLPRRTFPVDLAYPRSYLYTLRLRLPEGYGVQELPEQARILLPQEGGHFQRGMNVKEGVLTVQTQFVIKRSMFHPRHYASVRSFYEQVVAAGAEQVVLKQVDPSNSGNQEGDRP